MANGYAARKIRVNGKEKVLRMHRLLARTPDGMETDHINGDRLDNRKSNLRVCTHVQNMANQGKRLRNKSGFKGVVKQWSKWKARINVNGKAIQLGCYNTPEEAARAYNEAALRLNGEFAKINSWSIPQLSAECSSDSTTLPDVTTPRWLSSMNSPSPQKK